MQRLPSWLRKPILPWCSGTYYAPEFVRHSQQVNTIVEANSASYAPNGDIILKGNVTIQQPSRTLSAHKGTMNQQTGHYELAGNITVKSPTQSFSASHLEGNQRTEQSKLHNARFSLYASHARGTAAKAIQDGQVTYIYHGSYTTCAPGNNGWVLNAGKIKLDKKNGWGTAWNTVLNVEGIPVLYLPWITFPINDDRKTGLLFPTFSHTDQSGIDYTQPIYFNLAPQYDLTLAPRYISNRGVGMESEFRYLTHLGSGSLDYAFIEDDKLFNHETRELARWRHSGSYGYWSYGVDLNYVSDDFYFKDIGTNTLDNVSKTRLPRQAYLNYTRGDWRITTKLQSWQVIDPTLAKVHYPYRRLPIIELTGSPDIAGPFQVDWQSSYTYFDRGVENHLEGSRWHLQPAISLPFSNSWGYITPKVRVYSSYYLLHGKPGYAHDRESRSLVAANIDSGIFLERDMALGGGNYLQTLEPRLFYDYIPYRDQRDITHFDTSKLPFSYTSLFSENRFLGVDRIGDVNKLAMGVTSRIIDKRTGAERWRFRVGQGYYFDSRRVHLNPAAGPDTNNTTPLVADVTFQMDQHWSLFAQHEWSNGNQFKKQDIFRLGYHDPARRYAYLGYRKLTTGNSRITVNQVQVAGMWPITQHWSLLGSELFDLDRHQSIETVAGVEYRNCCWKIRLVNRRLLADYNGGGTIEPRTTLLFQIQLIGLSEFGDKVETLLEDTIPGYRRQDQ